MEALVQTDDIEQQKEKAWEETEKWAESARGEKVTKTSEDGYKLVAQEIYASSDSHQWALILHGYTAGKRRCTFRSLVQPK